MSTNFASIGRVIARETCENCEYVPNLLRKLSDLCPIRYRSESQCGALNRYSDKEIRETYARLLKPRSHRIRTSGM